MRLAKPLKKAPRDIAAAIVEEIGANELIAKTDIAGPGFINFEMTPAAFQQELKGIVSAGAAYGEGSVGEGKKVLLEFVSANPTGPMHVGHCRGATSIRDAARAGFDLILHATCQSQVIL